jgi:hypothetical protein
MLMIYGEGEKAFARLQEVMKDSADLSILAGASISPVKEHGLSYDLFLATFPSEFANCGAVIPCNAYSSKNRAHATLEALEHEKEYEPRTSVTDLRLKCPKFDDPETGEKFAVLSCCLEDNPEVLVGIPILNSSAEPQMTPDTSFESKPSQFGLIPRASVRFDKSAITIIGRRAGKSTSQSLPTQDWWYLRSSVESHGFKMIEFEPSTIKVANVIRILQSGSPQEIGPLQKLLFRFRETAGLGDDFVAALWFPRPSEPDFLCWASMVDRNVPLKHLAEGLTRLAFRSHDKEVKSGPLHLQVSVSQESFDRGNFFAVTLSASSVAQSSGAQSSGAQSSGAQSSGAQSSGAQSSVATRRISGNDIRSAVPQSFEEAEPHPTANVAHDGTPPLSQSRAALWPRLILPFLVVFFPFASTWTFACMLATLLLSAYWDGAPVILLQLAIWLLQYCIWVSLC